MESENGAAVVVILADLPNRRTHSLTHTSTPPHHRLNCHPPPTAHFAFVEVTIKKSANPARCETARARETEGGWHRGGSNKNRRGLEF